MFARGGYLLRAPTVVLCIIVIHFALLRLRGPANRSCAKSVQIYVTFNTRSAHGWQHSSTSLLALC